MHPTNGTWPNTSAWTAGIPHGTSSAVIRGIRGDDSVLMPYAVVVAPPGIAGNGYHPAGNIVLSVSKCNFAYLYLPAFIINMH